MVYIELESVLVVSLMMDLFLIRTDRGVCEVLELEREV